MVVYIVQEPKPKNGWTPDFSKAAEYGRLERVFTPDQRICSMPTRYMREAMNTLKDFDVENDFILWPNLGDPTALQCVCFALALLGFNKVRFLYWNRKRDSDGNKIDGFYMPLEFNLEKEHG